MEESILLQELQNLAEELDVELRYDEFEGQGGLCRYQGKTLLIVNRTLSTPERNRLIGRALARFSLEELFLRPQVREWIEKGCQEQRARKPVPARLYGDGSMR